MIQYLPVSSTCKLPAIRDEKEQQLLDFLKNLRVADAAKVTDLASLSAEVATLTATVAALAATVAGLAPGGGNGDIQYNLSGTFGGIAGHSSSPTYDLLASDGTTIIQMTFNGGVLTAVTVFP